MLERVDPFFQLSTTSDYFDVCIYQMQSCMLYMNGKHLNFIFDGSLLKMNPPINYTPQMSACSSYYRPQWKVMFSQASVILSTISLKANCSLLILVMVQWVCILLECFLVHCSFREKIRVKSFSINLFSFLSFFFKIPS